MKAFLLAGGRGERLRPLTDRTPKCLLDVAGVPMLERWLLALAGAGVDEVLVNTHHLAGQVENYVRRRAAGRPAVRLEYEPELLGSAGTVAAHADFVDGEKCFWVVYADNLTGVDLPAMREFHRSRPSPLTIALFRSPQPSGCGIVRLGAGGLVTDFEEKPDKPRGNLANAGIYIVSTRLVAEFPAHRPLDFGYHILPLMVGKMYGYPIDGFFFDVGTPGRLREARDYMRAKRENQECS